MTQHSYLYEMSLLRYTGPNHKNKSEKSDKVWGAAVLIAESDLYKGNVPAQLVTCWGPFGGTIQFERQPIDKLHRVSSEWEKAVSVKLKVEGYKVADSTDVEQLKATFDLMTQHPLVTTTSASEDKWKIAAMCSCGHAVKAHGTEGCIYAVCNCPCIPASLAALLAKVATPEPACINCEVNAAPVSRSQRDPFYEVPCTNCGTRIGSHRAAHPHGISACPGVEFGHAAISVANKVLGRPPQKLVKKKEIAPPPKPKPEPEPIITRTPRRISHLLPDDL